MKPLFAALLPVLLLATAPTINAPSFQKKMVKEQRAVHALNRVAFGPSEADLASIHNLGVERWIELQLHPERMPQSADLETRLAKLDSLPMTNEQIARHYPPPQLLRALAKRGSAADIKDPYIRARVESYLQRIKAKEAATGDDAGEKRVKGMRAIAGLLTPDEIRTLRQGTPADRRAFIAALPQEKRDKLMVLLPGTPRGELLYGQSEEMRRDAIASQNPSQIVYYDLAEAKLLRAVYSTHQLEEVMADFWFNHFNVFINKGLDRMLVTSYEREAIRPHVFGNFKDLLLATAKSPAMLVYLDNWTSISPDLDKKPRAKKGARGLNENYGRELLELHTLGVDGGYTQKDVTEVARCFTGWTVKQPRAGGEFFFNERMHDKGEKVVLGHRIPAGGGMEDGLRVIDILLQHPSTAHFISLQLAQRFVSDLPPPALVERMAKTFTKTHGDIRAVLETLFHSTEFWSEGAYRAKMKMPFEMVVSALRATGASIDTALAVQQELATLGQPLYRKVEPTGYYNTADEWTNSAALLARMNFALQLTQNNVSGIHVPQPQAGAPETIARSLLYREPGAETGKILSKAAAAEATPRKLAGLVLGSPEFQRR